MNYQKGGKLRWEIKSVFVRAWVKCWVNVWTYMDRKHFVMWLEGVTGNRTAEKTGWTQKSIL